MAKMPPKLKALQSRLGDSDFRFIGSGERSLSDEVYPAVQDQYPSMCDDGIKCRDICSGGTGSPEWQHRVRTVLHALADEPDSRVNKSSKYGYWYFE
jgi:hypothetical protein